MKKLKIHYKVVFENQVFDDIIETMSQYGEAGDFKPPEEILGEFIAEDALDLIEFSNMVEQIKDESRLNDINIELVDFEIIEE